MSECEESTDERPCQICMARHEISKLKDAIERKISLVQFLIIIMNKKIKNKIYYMIKYFTPNINIKKIQKKNLYEYHTQI